MRTPPLPQVAACMLLLLGTTALSAQPVTTFQLPPDPEEASRPQAQGPTDTEGENRAAPRVIGAPAPTPAPAERTAPTQANPRSTPAPAPSTDAASPRTSGPSLPASDRSVSTREVLTEQQRPAVRPSVPQPVRDTGTQSEQVDETSASGAGETLSAAASTTERQPNLEATQPPGSSSLASDTDGLPWTWIAALAAAILALLALAFAMLRRRSTGSGQRTTDVADLSGAPLREVKDHSYLTQPDAGSLEIEAYAVTLSRSVMNATISYRLTMLNQGREPISLIQVNGDVTTAHGRIPAAQQIADVDHSFPELHTLSRLEPGQRSTMRGELRLPLREVRALRQGNVPVFVPLLRLTVRAANLAPRAYTYVIGSKNLQKGARPNPFRLDEPPRSYAQLTTRAVA